MTINREAIRKWCEALESGKYKQGYGALTQVDCDGNEEDCCLGVAAKTFPEIAPAVRKQIVRSFAGKEVVAYGDEEEIAWDTLPRKLAVFLGINDSGRFPAGYFASLPSVRQKVFDCFPINSLMELNDEAKYSFKQIAKVIRKQFLGEDV